MKPFSIILFHFLLTACLFLPSAFADEILLKNGDQISGKIVKKIGTKIYIKTSYAGEIAIKWKEVNGITTDEPVEILLTDESITDGTATGSQVGSVELKESAQRIRLEDISCINPPPHISGKGVSWSGHINAGGAVADGNTDNKAVHVDGEIIARKKKQRYTAETKYNYAQDSDVETESNFFGSFKYDHFINGKWYLTGKTSYEKDKFKDLNHRTKIGAGTGYQVWDSKLISLSLEGGLDYVVEDFRTVEDEEYPAASWALNFKKALFQEKASFFHKHGLNIGLEDTEDIIFTTQTGIRVPFIDQFNTTFEVDWGWDNSPAEGKKRSDTSYIFSVGYSW